MTRCMGLGEGAMWVPVPESHVCTNIILNVTKQEEQDIVRSDSVCPEEISITCVVESNNPTQSLRWQVTFPELAPINYTYNSTSILNNNDTFSSNIAGNLVDFQYGHIVSIMVLKDAHVVGTIIECSIDDHRKSVTLNSSIRGK